MKNLLLVLALMALPLAAQDQKKEEPKEPQVQKLFVLKYADPNQISNLIRVFTGNVTPNAQMHALAVSAGPVAMAAIEDAIKRLDVPTAVPQNIELTVYLLVGTQNEGASAAAVPKDLDSVLAQLKAALAYKSYKLVDVLTLRGLTGRGLESSSRGWSVQENNNISYTVTTRISVQALSIGADGAMRIDGLVASNKAAGSSEAVVLRTDLNIKEGQKVVVGKIGMTPNEAMFVVLMAHVAP